MSEETINDTNVKPVKLPYFHRVLSDEDTKILGDNTPKRINEGDNQISTGKLSESSSWNGAGTWESRNCTDFLQKTLPPLLAPFEITDNNNNNVKIESCSDIEGTSEVVHTRGKVKYIYDATMDLKFIVTLPSIDKTYKGSLKLESVMPGDLDSIDLNITWNGGSPSGATMSVVNGIVMGNQMREELEKRIMQYEEAMKQL